MSRESTELPLESFFQALIDGDRPTARTIVEQSLRSGATAQTLLRDLFWPAYQTLDRMHRGDQLTRLAHHLGTRLLRVLVDQNAVRLTRTGGDGRSVLCICGPSDADELGAQMAVDMLEAGGFSVTFPGGGIANDEIHERVNLTKPDVLLLFASAPTDLPSIRELIDKIRENKASPNTQIAVGAGVFNRAEGLAEEIGADLWAESPFEMVERLLTDPQRRAGSDQRTVGKQRRKRAA